MKVSLISFCSGYTNTDSLIQRFLAQAKRCTYFNKIEVVTDGNPIYQKFMDKFGDFVKNNPRGFGYWIWKPYIVLEEMRRLDDGDILVYVDIGCEISSAGADEFNRYLSILKEKDFLAFSTYNGQEEFVWTKKELLDLFSLPTQKINQEQVAATFFLVRKSQKSIKILEEWLHIAELDSYRYIDDSCDSGQHKNFIENRHDQSIFSLLMKKYEMAVLRERTYHPPLLYYKNSYVYKHPIHALRSKGNEFFIKEKNLINFRCSFYYFIKYHLVFFGYRVYKKIMRSIGICS